MAGRRSGDVFAFRRHPVRHPAESGVGVTATVTSVVRIEIDPSGDDATVIRPVSVAGRS
jgi:hypothetical protein